MGRVAMADDKGSTIIFGSDEGLVCAEAQKVFAELTAGTDAFSHEVIDGTCLTVDEAVSTGRQTIEALMTLPFFPGLKVVWLKNANFLGDSVLGRSESTLALLDELAGCMGRLPGDVRFLLSATEIDKRRSFFKKAQQLAACREFVKIDTSKQGWETELSAFATREGKKRGLTFEARALELFIHRVNESSRQIVNELDKLDVYLGSERRTVAEKDVEYMVAVSRSGIVFEISRALEAGNCRQAIALVNEQLDAGEQPVSIMRAAVIPTVRNRLAAKILLENYHLEPTHYRDFEAKVRSLPDEARCLVPLKKDGTPNAYPFFLAAQKCAKRSLPRLKNDLAACAEADRTLVSSGLDARDVLHKLFVILTS